MTEHEHLFVKVNAQLTAEQLRQFEAIFEADHRGDHRARFVDDEDDV